jgi:hypothetical protein
MILSATLSAFWSLISVVILVILGCSLCFDVTWWTSVEVIIVVRAGTGSVAPRVVSSATFDWTRGFRSLATVTKACHDHGVICTSRHDGLYHTMKRRERAGVRRDAIFSRNAL